MHVEFDATLFSDLELHIPYQAFPSFVNSQSLRIDVGVYSSVNQLLLEAVYNVQF